MVKGFKMKMFQGSGKTYTVGGTDSAGLLEEEYGIILRAVKQLFHIMEVHVHVYVIFYCLLI